MAKDNDPVYVRVFFGGTACSVATCVTNPIDVIKVNMQVAHQGNAQGMLGTAKSIYARAGILGFWQGISPALIRAYVYTGSRIGFYGSWKSFWGADHTPTAARKIAAGVCSGAVAATVANPTEVVKVRMQADGARYTSTIGAFRSVAASEGMAGLLAGVVPHVLRGGVITSSQVACYDIVKTEIKAATGLEEDKSWWSGVALHLCSSLVAGLSTTTASSPFDVVKTRVMSSGGGIAPAVRGVYKDYGFLGFFRGWLPNYSRLGPHTVIIMVVYEQLNKLVGNKGI